MMTEGPSMRDSQSKPEPAATAGPERRPMSPAAKRALAEAEARKRTAAGPKPLPKEYQGPKGPEPTRYGDWERNGIASDF